SARFGELRGGAFGVVFESIGRSKECAEERMRRSGTARLFVPDDCLVGARLQQMRAPDPEIVKADLGIARTEPDGLLLGRDKLLYQPGHELAPAKMGVCVGPVAVERDGCLVFENGLVVSVLRAQHLASGKMC